MIDRARPDHAPRWQRQVLMAAAIYNLAWGAAVVLQPLLLFQLVGMEPPRYPGIWQCVGMIVGVYGAGYAIAAADPWRHWPIVLVGLLGKIFGPIGFLFSAFRGDLPWSFGWTILTNDLIWWAPFASILYFAWKHHADCACNDEASQQELMECFRSNRGASIGELSKGRLLLLIFIRHSGCTFCREMLADLAEQRGRLEARGVEIGVVHMSPPLEATQLAIRYQLEGVHMFSDPHCRLYEAFGLRRGSLVELFGPKVWWRGIWAGVIEGHGIGRMQGDGFRLQGAFAIRDSVVLAACQVRTAADPVDFISLCKAANSVAEPVELVG